MKELYRFRQFLAEGVIKEEVDVLGNEFTQEIQDDMKMYYKMDVDMDDIKDWVKFYYIGYNSEYDEGPGDVDYEGNEFGSEDYESEKKELVFDTAEREDFYMHLNPEADSTFPNLKEDYDKESLIKALGDADDAFIQLSDGRELIIYNPNSNNDDNVDMWGDYGVFAVSDDGDEEEVLYSDIAGINL